MEAGARGNATTALNAAAATAESTAGTLGAAEGAGEGWAAGEASAAIGAELAEGKMRDGAGCGGLGLAAATEA